MNLVIDGQQHEPSVISQFNGQALYSTPGVDAKGEETLYSFTSLDALRERLSAHSQRNSISARDIATSNPDSLPELSYYFEDATQQGDYLQNGPGRAWQDLTRVNRGFLHLSDWNDVISSVDWCRWDISLYSDINYGGSQLYLPAGQTYDDLGRYGWNDVASSTVNWGQRF